MCFVFSLWGKCILLSNGNGHIDSNVVFISALVENSDYKLLVKNHGYCCCKMTSLHDYELMACVVDFCDQYHACHIWCNCHCKLMNYCMVFLSFLYGLCILLITTSGADLSDADLRGADFSLANVTKVISYVMFWLFHCMLTMQWCSYYFQSFTAIDFDIHNHWLWNHFLLLTSEQMKNVRYT